MVVRKILLGCGIVSSVLYVATDILATLRYKGYSYSDYTFSELLAEGAPTRSLMVALNGIPYPLLVSAFAVGVGTLPGRQRVASLTGAALGGYAVTGMVGGVLVPTTPRGTKGTLRNVMHIPATAVMSVFILLAIGSGARLLDKRFRYYSYGTIPMLLVFGALTSAQAGRLAGNEPTPWMGLEERINIYGTMLWIAVLATGLLRAEHTSAHELIQVSATGR